MVDNKETKQPVSRKASRKARQAAQVQSTGHSWDGIEEYDNPLPRWWLWIFYLCIIWAIGYVIAYPAWPLIKNATPGLLGFSSRAEVQAEINKFNEELKPYEEQIDNTELTAIAANPDLASYANHAGASVFRTWCAQCHGSGAQGNVGYPNLLDNDWLWGGTIDEIYTTIQHGIRSMDDPDTRITDMPRFGVDGLLDDQQIRDVTQYVLKISGDQADAAQAEAGATVYADNCASCHGEDGKGVPEMGAPNLTDAIWLYGGTPDEIYDTVYYARNSVMPAWSVPGKLSEADIRAVSFYVHGLGGGQ